MTRDERIAKLGTACAALSLLCEGRVTVAWFRDWWRRHWEFGDEPKRLPR